MTSNQWAARKSTIRLVSYSLVVVLLATGSAARASDERGLQLIAMAKAASGGSAWDRLEIMHDTGIVILESHEKVRYEHWGDLRNLRTRAGTGGGDMIFDGNAAYKCQSITCDRRAKLNSIDIKSATYFGCFGFFFPDRFPASFEYKGMRVEGGSRYDIVAVSPIGLQAAELWIHHDSHLIFRTVNLSDRSSADLTDYRKVSGVRVPFAEVIGGLTFRAQNVTFEPIGSESFSLPGPLTR